MKTVITSSFLLFGNDFEPQELLEIIKIKPSNIWKIGERKIKDNPILLHSENGWALTINSQHCMCLGSQIRDLVNKLNPHIKQILTAQKKFKLSAAFTSAVYIYSNEIPSIHLESDIVRLINDLEAFIDIDIYNV
ncbi:MAG: DUF4279 domain-containing protein [Candidatus Omnitrophica bacterium]|nr:DUF4279 domain-containing protein [Candidatus Omnitrophota bacterium]